MKKFLLVPMLALSLTLPLVGSEETAQNEPVTVEQTLSPQQKLIDAVLADYRAGKYNNFLKQSDEDYKDSEKKFAHNDLLEQRKKLSTMVHDYGNEKTTSLQEKITALHNAEHRELMKICLKHPNEKISSEVRDMIFFSPSKKEQESIEYIHGLSLKFKGDGLSPIENKLIAIDTEFWLKNMALEIAHVQKKTDQDSFEKKALVLQLEKIKQMQEACKGDLTDVKIKSYVETAATVLPKVYASSATHKHLLALGRGKVAPSTPAEQEMQGVVAKYLEKEAALTEKAYPSK
ncbi:MAG: hypothetical protein H7A38_07150 [Chlamydiales bacterium]|nr:hypothetical protein [Chlamydiales bacterium]